MTDDNVINPVLLSILIGPKTYLYNIYIPRSMLSVSYSYQKDNNQRVHCSK